MTDVILRTRFYTRIEGYIEMKYIKQTLSQNYIKFIRLPLLVVIQDTSDTNNRDFEYNRNLQIGMCQAETQTSWPAYLGNLPQPAHLSSLISISTVQIMATQKMPSKDSYQPAVMRIL